jgi:hypothetical protein
MLLTTPIKWRQILRKMVMDELERMQKDDIT